MQRGVRLSRERASRGAAGERGLVAGLHGVGSVRGQGAGRRRPQSGFEHQPALSAISIACRSSRSRTCTTRWRQTSGAAPRLAELRRRMNNAILPEAGTAHVEELTDPYLLWFWNSNIRSTAIVLNTLVRARATADRRQPHGPLAGRRPQERTLGQHAGKRRRDAGARQLLPQVREPGAELHGARCGSAPRISCAQTFKGRSADATVRDVPMAQLAQGRRRVRAISRCTATGEGTLFYATRLTYAPDAATLTAARSRLQRRARSTRRSPTAKPARWRRRSRPATSSASRWRSICRRSAATSPSPIRCRPGSSRSSRGSRRPRPTWRARGAGRRRVDAELAGHLAARHVRPRRAPRRSRAAVRDAARRGPPRVLVRRARDDAGTFQAAPARVEEMYEPEVSGRTATQSVEVKR